MTQSSHVARQQTASPRTRDCQTRFNDPAELDKSKNSCSPHCIKVFTNNICTGDNAICDLAPRFGQIAIDWALAKNMVTSYKIVHIKQFSFKKFVQQMKAFISIYYLPQNLSDGLKNIPIEKKHKFKIWGLINFLFIFTFPPYLFRYSRHIGKKLTNFQLTDKKPALN